MSYENMNEGQVEYIDEDFAGRTKRASRWLLISRLQALAMLGVIAAGVAVYGVSSLGMSLPVGGVVLAVLYSGQRDYAYAMADIKHDKEDVAIQEQENINGDGI